jgi:DNA-binding NarL/FixJ family response regulator
MKLNRYTLVLADDHAMFRKGIKKILTGVDDLEVIGEAGDGLELLDLLKEISPHMVILDIAMPNLRGLEATREIKQIYPKIKILLLTMHKKREFIEQAMRARADGYLLKEDADTELLQAINTIRQGNKFISQLLTSELADLVMRKGDKGPLSLREREVMQLLAEGKSSKETADSLHISVFTVRRHRESIRRKLNLKSMADLVKYAIDHGYASSNS